MNMKIAFKNYMGLLFVLGTIVGVHAQQVLYSTHPSIRSGSYYINLNEESIGYVVHEVIDTMLSLKYEDRAGVNKVLPLAIVNWRNELVGNFNLSKTSGLNYYDIDMKKFSKAWEYNTIYHCRYIDDEETEHDVSFKILEPAKKEAPSVSIFVNPINTQCDNVSKSYIAFLGEIKGGKAPYKLTWYVLNKNQSDLLFIPKEQFLNAAAQSPMISVDAFLDYYVVLNVEDACGTTGKQMVHVRCEEEGENHNTIFLQPLNIYSNSKSTN